MYIYKQLDSSFLKYVNYLYNKFPEKLFIDSVTILPVFGGKCDSTNLVGSVPQATMAASGCEYGSSVTHRIL